MISIQIPEDGTTGSVGVGWGVSTAVGIGVGRGVGTVVGSGVGAACRKVSAGFSIVFMTRNPPAAMTRITMTTAIRSFERFRFRAAGSCGGGDTPGPGAVSAFSGSFKRSRTILLAFLALS